MLKIRLQRTGRKHEPTFRLVLTDSKNSAKTGKFLEILGSHDFRNDNTDIKKERVLHWMKHGVKPSPTVHNLLITHKIIEGKKINVLPRRTPKKKKGEPLPTSPLEQVEVPKAEEAPAPAPATPPVAQP